MENYLEDFNEEIKPDESNTGNEHAIIDLESRYFGPGSIYHFQNFSKPDTVPLIRSNSFHAITLEEDFDYVADIVRYFFENQYPNVFLFMFDKTCILKLLEERNFKGPFLNAELVYAICANCERLLYEEADAYRNLVSRMIFMDNLSSSIAIAQAYVLLAVHDISKGQISNGWLLSGLGFRCGTDIGFDMNNTDDLNYLANRFYMSSIVIDTYIALSVGRRSTLQLNNLSILRLPGESDTDYLNLKYCVELVELTRGMIRSTYQPVMFDKDPKINYLLKFNRSKAFNVKLLKWKAGLDAKCYWQYNSLKNSKTLATDNHSVKYLYYFLLLFLNKPFLHVPKQHSTVYIIEEISKEMYVIVTQQLELLQAGVGAQDSSKLSPRLTLITPFTENDAYHWASMDVCMLTLLSHVLVTLITSQPQHYMYLERHFKVFAQFLNIVSPRKYKAKDNPIQKLYVRYVDFKSKVLGVEGDYDTHVPGYEMNQLREAISADGEDTQDSYSACSDSSSNGKAGYSETSMLSGDLNITKNVLGHDAIGPNVKHEPAFLDSASFPNASVAQEDIFIPMPIKVDQVADTLNRMQMMQQRYPNVDQQKVYQNIMQPQQQSTFANVLPVGYSELSFNQQHVLEPAPHYAYAQPYYTYDQLPPAQDPVGNMMNSLFSNTGQEFATGREQFNWDALFKDEYTRIP